MKVRNFVNVTKFNDTVKCEDGTDIKVSWNQINWEQAELYINRLQTRIVKATRKKKWRLVKRLQYLIMKSFYGRAIAVKRVISNKGKNTPGIDGELWRSNETKERAIKELNVLTYRSLPLKRVFIKKYGKKEKRPLSIPTMRDRAMQSLALLGLEPIAETNADRVSFGFRKYRSTHDAMERGFSLLCNKYAPTWILEGDIKGCFDSISHHWLMENVKMDKNLLKKFVKSGFVYKKKLFPTEYGTPQGGTISPTLANLTLDGMESIIANNYWKNKKGTIDPKNNNKKKVHLIRYADDFVVTATDKDTLIEVKKLLSAFLEERGLTLSDEKTKISKIEDGFDFLGWNFRKYNGKLIIKPSNQSISKIRDAVSEVIKLNKTSTQEKLIFLLNQRIRGWANYHQVVCAKQVFSKIDHSIWEMLWHWSKRRHPNKSKAWIISKYWETHRGRKWCFKTEKNILTSMSDTPIIRHKQLQLNRNPFVDTEYFEKREKERRYKRKKAISTNAAAQLKYYAL